MRYHLLAIPSQSFYRKTWQHFLKSMPKPTLELNYPGGCATSPFQQAVCKGTGRLTRRVYEKTASCNADQNAGDDNHPLHSRQRRKRGKRHVRNAPPQSNPISIDVIYARLNQRDIEQFYAGYQRWTLQQQISTLEAQLDALRGQIAENTERMQEVHTSAIALATLARLQSNGVNDIDFLDRMLEQGQM